jgi:hypothetical protein
MSGSSVGATVRNMHAFLAIAVAAILATAGVAVAAGPTINVDPHRVHRGELVRVFGVVPGCPRGDQVTLLSRAFSHRHEFASVPAIFATVRSGHHYSKRTRIPAGRRARRYAVRGRCGGGNLGVTAHLRVLR